MLSNCRNDEFVKTPVGHDHAFVFRQGGSVMKLCRTAIDVADPAAGFFHEQDASGVIPDFLLVPFLSWQTEVNVGVTAGHSEVLALTVDTKRVTCDVQFGSDVS